MEPNLVLASTNININQPCFIIAEIGQNHQGDIETAKKLIDVAQKAGATCVKFQKTCIEEKFTLSFLQKPYTSSHSFGATYGEHKAHLEFTNQEFMQLQQYSESLGLIFTASAMDIRSLHFLNDIALPFIKIGSGDFNNLPLIEEAAKLKIPLVISTGMANREQVKAIYETVSKYHKKFALLHCVSAYPTPIQDVNLRVIEQYRKDFPDIIIGYSGHEVGIDISVAAAVLGAKIIERHITLDKNMKGTDHSSSLEPGEFKLMIQKVHSVQAAMGNPIKAMQFSERECYNKLGKSLVAGKPILKGTALGKHNLKIKVSEPKGLDASEFQNVILKKVKKDMEKDEPILAKHIT